MLGLFRKLRGWKSAEVVDTVTSLNERFYIGNALWIAAKWVGSGVAGVTGALSMGLPIGATLARVVGVMLWIAQREKARAIAPALPPAALPAPPAPLPAGDRPAGPAPPEASHGASREVAHVGRAARGEVDDLKRAIQREFKQVRDEIAHGMDELGTRQDALEAWVREAHDRRGVWLRVDAAVRQACIRLLTLRMIEDVLRDAPRLPAPEDEAALPEDAFAAAAETAAVFVLHAEGRLRELPAWRAVARNMGQVEAQAQAAVRQMPAEERPAGVDAIAFQDYRVAVARCRHVAGGLSHYRSLLVAGLGEPLDTLSDLRTVLMPPSAPSPAGPPSRPPPP